MPFQSEAQRRFLWARHPEVAQEWADHTPKGTKLPYHKKKTKKPVSKRAEYLHKLATILDGELKVADDAALQAQLQAARQLQMSRQLALLGGAALSTAPFIYGMATAPKGRRLHGGASTSAQTTGTLGGIGLGALAGAYPGLALQRHMVDNKIGNPWLQSVAAGLPVILGGALGGNLGSWWSRELHPGPKQLGLGDREPGEPLEGKQAGVLRRELDTPVAIRFAHPDNKHVEEPALVQTHEPTWLGRLFGADPLADQVAIAQDISNHAPSNLANYMGADALASLNPRYFKMLRHRMLGAGDSDTPPPNLQQVYTEFGKRMEPNQKAMQELYDEPDNDNGPLEYKAAAHVEKGRAVSRFVGNTLGRLGGLPMLLATSRALHDPGNARNSEKHKEITDDMTRARPDELKDTVVRLGGGNLIDDLIWKKERDGELPWYKQLGGRLMQNKNTSPLGKLLGAVGTPLEALLTPLSRVTHYNPYTDAISLYQDDPAITSHELGRAINYNKTNTPTQSSSYLGRMPRKLLRDVYSVADPLSFGLYHDYAANRDSYAALQDSYRDNPDKLDAISSDRQRVLPATYATNVGSLLGALGGPAAGALGGPVVSDMAPTIGRLGGLAAGRLYGIGVDKHNKRRQAKSAAKQDIDQTLTSGNLRVGLKDTKAKYQAPWTLMVQANKSRISSGNSKPLTMREVAAEPKDSVLDKLAKLMPAVFG